MRKLGIVGLLGLSMMMAVACAGAKNRGPEVANGGKGGANGNQIAEGDPQDQGEEAEWGIISDTSYPTVVQKVVGMVGDSDIQRATDRRGLDALNVTWEDTGRAEGSALGPNISDFTLQVRYRQRGDDREMTALMPVIRFPNFTDRTG